MIACQKHLFDIPEGTTYLNCSYMSPQLRSVSDAGRAALARKEQPWRVTPADFFKESEQTRSVFADLIEANPDDIAFIPSASYGLAVAAKNLKVEEGSKIVLLADQFPSNVLIWQQLARQKNAEVILLKDPLRQGWDGLLLDAIDEGASIVALPNSHWTDGRLIDLNTVASRCRKTGTALVLDLTQSAGALPFSVKTIQPDFMITAAYKWLCGPYSIGFLYVHPKHQHGEPLEHNWINRKHSEDFARLVEYQAEFQEGARRFDVGERSNFMLMPMALVALNQLSDWQIPQIMQTIGVLTGNIAERAAALGLLVPPPSQMSPHFLGLGFPSGIPAGMLENLREEQVHVSIRGNSMRISPHLYNSQRDVDRLFSVLNAQFR